MDPSVVPPVQNEPRRDVPRVELKTISTHRMCEDVENMNEWMMRKRALLDILVHDVNANPPDPQWTLMNRETLEDGNGYIELELGNLKRSIEKIIRDARKMLRELEAARNARGF